MAAPESVAADAHGVALAAIVLLDLEPAPLDRARVLAMAVLHDLPESVTGDLPSGAAAHLPSGAKHAMESAALDALLGGLPFAPAWRALWLEYEARETPEARLVRDADRLDLLLQALAYEETTGNRRLAEFWDGIAAEPFATDAARELAARLAADRGAAA